MSRIAPSRHPASCTCPGHPLDPSMRVRDALSAYLDENGFTRAAYDDAWTKASFFGLPLAVPNTKRHRWAIMLHDLHHVATGFGTDLPGEGEVSAWEVRGGLGGLDLYVTSIVLAGALAGVLLVPRRTLRAYRAAVANLFHASVDYEALLDGTVGELRERLGVPREGLATAPRLLHPDAPRAGLAHA